MVNKYSPFIYETTTMRQTSNVYYGSIILNKNSACMKYPVNVTEQPTLIINNYQVISILLIEL
jgi:hypothetical protein